VHCNEAGKYVIYESDEHGFHNPKGIWGTNSLDIVALGDSFTQGSCVASDENFVSVIREHYPKTLNLGMSGQGPLNTLATLKDYVQALKPNVVLWFFFEGNDVADLFYERQSPLLMRYLDGFSQRLGERQVQFCQ
jgi:lysophospholipase L1-like esterase